MPGLAERMRPQTLEDVIGNTDTVESLRAWLQAEEKHQTLLFWGPIGCGKTTLAQIVARELGTVPPLSFTEYDASHYQSSRVILDDIGKLGLSLFSRGRLGYSVRFFDEAHHLPPSIQAALLKKAENPPKKVILIFAALDPDPKSILPALLSRCRKFPVAPLNRTKTTLLLRRACEAEGMNIQESELQRIAKDAAGFPRDALIQLEEHLDLIRAKPSMRKRDTR